MTWNQHDLKKSSINLKSIQIERFLCQILGREKKNSLASLLTERPPYLETERNRFKEVEKFFNLWFLHVERKPSNSYCITYKIILIVFQSCGKNWIFFSSLKVFSLSRLLIVVWIFSWLKEGREGLIFIVYLFWLSKVAWKINIWLLFWRLYWNTWLV